MASKTPTIHIFILSYPAQGQINPLLRLGKRLASTGGFLVTFVTTAYSRQNIIKANGISLGQLYPVGDGFLRFDFFDVDDSAHINPFRQAADFIPKMELSGRKRIPEMLRRLADEGRPVSCLINGTMFPWAYDVADELGIPIATMWAQSCASFLTFYYCYNELVPFPSEEDPYTDVEIPTLPLLKWDELHSFLHPSYPEPSIRKSWLGEFQNLDKPFCILMDTFDELERDTVEFTSNLCPVIMPIGPLFKDPIAPNSALRGNPQEADTDCLGWLDSKPRRSVVYVCFGSLAHLKQEQVDEIAHGILNAGAPFLWVMRPPEPNSNLKPHTLPEKAGPDDGRVVEYSPQEEVLAHPSVGCFVTHCGWNSTMEALTSGVPMVAFPQWGDQLTDAKFLVDVFGVAVRMGRGDHEDKVVPREEVERCIREAMVGPKAEEMRTNALAWKQKAEKAYQEGGSSNRNLRGFVDEIRRRSGEAVEDKA